MRGNDQQQSALFSYVSPELRVPQDHPLRPARRMADAALKTLSPRFAEMYVSTGRPSIAAGKLLRALLLQRLHSVRSERMLMEQLDGNLLFRWFAGLNLDEPIGDATRSSKNRERVLGGAMLAGSKPSPGCANAATAGSHLRRRNTMAVGVVGTSADGHCARHGRAWWGAAAGRGGAGGGDAGRLRRRGGPVRSILESGTAQRGQLASGYDYGDDRHHGRRRRNGGHAYRSDYDCDRVAMRALSGLRPFDSCRWFAVQMHERNSPGQCTWATLASRGAGCGVFFDVDQGYGRAEGARHPASGMPSHP